MLTLQHVTKHKISSIPLFGLFRMMRHRGAIRELEDTYYLYGRLSCCKSISS